jgi:hypothetical protein
MDNNSILHRTKPRTNRQPTNGSALAEAKRRLQVLSVLTQRLTLARNMGISYDGDRDLYEALGYKNKLDWEDYYSQYKRQDIAKAVIDRPVRATWQGEFRVYEAEDDKETTFEKAWDTLDDALKLKPKFSRLDRLTGIGKYGVLLLGLDDVKDNDGWKEQVKPGKRKLLYLMPFGSEHAKIHTWEKRPDNERYGQPLLYNIEVTTPEGTETKSLQVHYTRVIHVVDDPLENEIEGTPRLQAVFNRLKDAEKVVGGSAEMFWRGARPGYQGKLDKDFTINTDTEDDLMNQIDEYEHNLRRILLLEGIDLQALQMQVSSPKEHVDVIIQMISMEKGIPKRILTGSERGELASSQDRDEWLTYVKNRREEFVEPCIVRPFVDACIQYRILPKPPDGYSVKWEDLFAPSEKDKVDIGKVRASALKEYVSQPAEHIVPAPAFYRYFLGLSEDDISQIEEIKEAEMAEEEPVTPEEEEIIEQEEQQQEQQEQ